MVRRIQTSGPFIAASADEFESALRSKRAGKHVKGKECQASNAAFSFLVTFIDRAKNRSRAAE